MGQKILEIPSQEGQKHCYANKNIPTEAKFTTALILYRALISVMAWIDFKWLKKNLFITRNILFTNKTHDYCVH